jgi:very-short-patch-repair endonuclease
MRTLPATTPKLVIEIDGRSHTDPDYDASRQATIEKQGYRVLRVGNDEVQRELYGVIVAVQNAPGIEK